VQDVEGFQGDPGIAFTHFCPQFPKDGGKRVERSRCLVRNGEESVQVLGFDGAGVWARGFDHLPFQFRGERGFEFPKEDPPSVPEVGGKEEEGGRGGRDGRGRGGRLSWRGLGKRAKGIGGGGGGRGRG
jgi:hypothetical protein